MSSFDIFKPVTTSPQRIAELEEIMADAYDVLRETALVIHYNDDPRFIKKMRNDWKTGKLSLHNRPQTLQALQAINNIESEVLASFIKCSTEMCKAFYFANRKTKIGLTIDDLYNEAACAIYDAMYTFKGGNRFSTYCVYCIKNHLIEVLRKENNLANSNHRVEFDDESIKRVPAPHNDNITELADLSSLVNQIDLTPTEENVVKWVLTGDPDWRKKMADGVDGKPMSKAWVSAAYVSLSKKLKEVALQAA